MTKALSAKEVRELAQEYHVKFVRLQFTDVQGAFKNVAITVEELERALEGAVAFDSAAVDGFDGHREDDILLYPDPSTFAVFPWRPRDGAVARLICEARTATGDVFPGCSRSILKRALAPLQERGRRLSVGVESEFFLFHTDGQGRPDLRPHDQAGYCALTPLDLGENARRDMVLTLEEMGIEVTSSHHESAPGQHEIGLKDDYVVSMADKVSTFRFVARTVAQRHGLHATFMPKPFTEHAGSGMTLNVSLWSNGENLFCDAGDPRQLSRIAYQFIAGLVRHAPALAAITNPLVNSYKRMLPGRMSPLLAGWSQDNRCTMLRVPVQRTAGTRLVLRSPDSTANPYLALAGIVAAGMDGVTSAYEAPEPLPDGDSVVLAAQMREHGLPRNLGEALEALAGDRVIRGVLGDSIYRRYAASKRDEWERFQRQVHAWEVDEYLTAF